MLHLFQVGALLLLPDPGSLSQNLRGWLNHGLELPCFFHPPASLPPPRLSSSAPSHTPPPTYSDVVDSSLPLPSHPPLLNTYPLSAFALPSTPPPTSTQPINNSQPHHQQTPHPPQNLRILRWNVGGLSPSRRAELIAFLSSNQRDLIFFQETHLSATKKFQIPGYSTLRTDRTFGRQGPVSFGGHNTGGGALTLVHSDLAFSPVSVSSLSSQDPHSDYICVKVLFPTTLPYNSLTSTPLLSEALLLILAPGPSILTSFQTPLTLLFLEISMLTSQPGTVSSPLTRPKMTCFAGSLSPVLKS